MHHIGGRPPPITSLGPCPAECDLRAVTVGSFGCASCTLGLLWFAHRGVTPVRLQNEAIVGEEDFLAAIYAHPGRIIYC
jgi:hypothetical protein